MKIHLENEDMASLFLFDVDKLHIGAYTKAIEAAKRVQNLPWCAPATYVESVLSAISSFYREQANKEIDK